MAADRFDSSAFQRNAAERRNTNAPGQPLDVKAAFDQAFRHFQGGQMQDARNLLVAVLNADTKHVPAMDLLARVSLALGDLANAANLWAAAITHVPTNVRYQVNLGRALRLSGRFHDAYKVLAQACALAPESVEAQVNCANVLAELGEHKTALTHYRAALKLAPDDARIYANLAALLESRGRFDAAAKAIRKGLEASSKAGAQNWTLVFAAARLERRAGQVDKAAKRLSALIDDSQESEHEPALRLEFGMCLDANGDYAGALQQFKRANQLRLRAQRSTTRRARFGEIASAAKRRLPELAESPRTVVTSDSVAHTVFVFGFPGAGALRLAAMLRAAGHDNVHVNRGALARVAAKRGAHGTLLTTEEALALRAELAPASDNDSPSHTRVEVEPVGALFVDVCREVFPDAKFIYVRRDADDLSLTTLVQPHVVNDLTALLLRPQDLGGALQTYDDLWTDASQQLGLKALEVDYDDLVGNDIDVWDAVKEFLGLPALSWPVRLDPALDTDSTFAPGHASNYRDWLQS